jgi:glucose-6-phosphate dehydrogenase assembly protein OpcA
VLRLYGELANEGASCVVPLLLPDTPVVAWWPNEAPPVPAQDPIGQLAQRRITDAAAEKNPIKALEQRKAGYRPGDTDLAWTRLTLWRAMLASAFDLPPYEKVNEAEVSGESDSPSTDLLAAWLAGCLRVPVKRVKATRGEGIVDVRLERRSGLVELSRPDGKVGTLTQPGQPERRVALQRRQVRDCLAEELRRLDPDEVYEMALRSLGKVVRSRTAPKAAAATRKPARAASGAAKAKSDGGPGAKAADGAVDGKADGQVNAKVDVKVDAKVEPKADVKADTKVDAKTDAKPAKAPAKSAPKTAPKAAPKAAAKAAPKAAKAKAGS